MGWEGNSIFQVVIIPGGGGGLFVYNGAPGVGNLVFSVVAPGVTSDPFGNTVSAVLNAGNLPSSFTRIDGNGNLQILNGGAVDIVLNAVKKAMFFYSPSLGAGNLIFSLSQSSGTDSVGNAYLPGATSYLKITGTDFQAYEQSGGGFNIWTATSNAGPWSLNLSGGLDLLEQKLQIVSNLNGGEVDIGGPSAALNWIGAATGDTLFLTKAGGAPLLEADNQNNASTPTIRVKTLLNGVQQLAYAVLATTDTNARMTVGLDPNGNGRLNAGSGAASPDVALFRAAPNVWAADDIAYNNASAAETWHAPTFANSWANAAIGPNFQYKRVCSPNLCDCVVGNLTVPAGFALGQNITTAIAALYRPANPGHFHAMDTNNGNLIDLVLSTGGNFQLNAGTTAAGHTLVIPCQLISTDA